LDAESDVAFLRDESDAVVRVRVAVAFHDEAFGVEEERDEFFELGPIKAADIPACIRRCNVGRRWSLLSHYET
jgi:hypothetical protein